MSIVIKIENLSKMYRLGEVGTGTLSHDLNKWWARIRGKEDPYLKIGEVNYRSKSGASQYVWALQDMNIEVAEGEVLGIIGKNGAGKSTLLKLLSKVTGPTTGSIKARGRIASLLEVGTGFHPELTGRENIFLNGAILGMTKKEVQRKLEEIVDFAGVSRYLDTPVKRYSSGMKVRLGFAVAAHLEPEILVVDEVLAVGDAEFQKRAIGKMKQVSNESGRTVLFVSHNMGSILSLCNNCLVLENGRVATYDKADKAIDFYLEHAISAQQRIAERADRRGIGILKFTETWINQIPSGQQEITIYMADSLEVSFLLEKQQDVPLKAIEVVFSIHHSRKGIVSTFSSLIENFQVREAAKIECSCTVTSLHLLPGSYFINLFCAANGERQDAIHNVFKLNVMNSPIIVDQMKFYDSSKHGVVRLDQIWRKA